MRLKYCLPRLRYELWVLPAAAYLTWDSLTSRFILFRLLRSYYYYSLLFSLFFLCTYPFPNSYSFCTPDLRLFPAHLPLFHFIITAHIFPSLSSTTFITFSFPLSFIHSFFPCFHLLYFSFTFIFALLSLPPFPPHILPNSLYTFFPPPFLFVSTFLFVLAVRPNSLLLSALSFRQFLFNFCSSVGIVTMPQAGRSRVVVRFLAG